MLDIDVKAMIWEIYTSATVKAAVHLGQDYRVQPRIQTSNMSQPFFDISQKLILDHKREIFGISTIEWNTAPWMRTTLLHDRAIELSKAKVHV